MHSCITHHCALRHHREDIGFCRRVGRIWRQGKPERKNSLKQEATEKRREAGNGCRIAIRRRKGSACGLALRAPLPRRTGMRRAGRVFPKNREDETRTQRSQPWQTILRNSASSSR